MELGLFILLLVMAFIFTFIGMRSTSNTSSYFKIIAVAIWLIMAVISGAGEGVMATSTSTDGIETWTTERVFIPEGETGFYLTYIFTGLAIWNLVMYVKETWAA